MSTWLPDLAGRSGPKYLALVDALAEDVASGALAEGARLPTHRDLAWRLQVTVGTIARAYAEAERRGLVSGEVGRGTYVRVHRPEDEPAINLYLGADVAARSGVIDMAVNRPARDQGAGIVGPALAALARRPDLPALLAYNLEPAFARHREAAARWLAKEAVRTTADRVVIGVGSQQCLVAALAATTRPGDTVLVEDFTYPGIRSAASLLGRELVPVATDEGGLVPDDLERALARTRAKVLYIIATVHNPLNCTLDKGRRRYIARVMEGRDGYIIEDGIHRFLHPDAPPPFHHFSPDRVLYISALAKSVSPGLRVGFMAVPPALKARADAAVGATTLTLATPLVEVASMLIEDGSAFQQAERQRQDALARVELAAAMLGEAVRPASASFNVWLPLTADGGWRSAELVVELARRGVAVAPTESFQVGHSGRDGIRISISSPATHKELRDGLMIIADTLSTAPVHPGMTV